MNVSFGHQAEFAFNQVATSGVKPGNIVKVDTGRMYQYYRVDGIVNGHMLGQHLTFIQDDAAKQPHGGPAQSFSIVG